MSHPCHAKISSMAVKPGVYQFINSADQVIYVGKAKNLKNRLSSYFQKNTTVAKIQVMMPQVVDIRVIITETEAQALLLEANLIKKLKPKYNVLLKDDKSFPFLYLNTNHKFPSLDLYRGSQSKPGRYFGPYPNVKSVRETLAMLQKLFKIRQCSDNFFANRSRPCLQYQIDRCTAPCVNYVSKEDYQEQVSCTELFLTGHCDDIITKLSEQMDDAAENLQYEKAAVMRDQIAKLREIHLQQASLGKVHDLDILALEFKQGSAVLAMLFVRGGQLIGDQIFHIKIPAETNHEEILTSIVAQYYLNDRRRHALPQRIYLKQPLQDRQSLQQSLQQVLSKKIRLCQAGKGVIKKWQTVAVQTAEHALSARLLEKAGLMQQFSALSACVSGESEIEKVACYDISHTQGELTVGACVVCGPEGFIRSEYRRFNIEGITGGDDYAAMEQVITRQFSAWKENQAMMPDVLLVDGGKGQLSRVMYALEELQITGLIVIGIAKGPGRKSGLETLYLAHKRKSIQLAMDGPEFLLLQKIRDEAHRFAITGHRARRDKKRQQSVLQDIPGVGPKKRKELLTYFGGLKGLMNASIDEIAKVSGINNTLAKVIHESIHN